MGIGLRFAIELILLTALTGIGGPVPVRFLSMSSRLLPCVSGTKKMTKKRAANVMKLNAQKVPWNPNIVEKSTNVLVTMNVHDQLNAVTREAADPRILAGKISPIISHGIGPKPIENPIMYTAKLRSGSHPYGTTS